ncbi:dihydroorotase [Polycladomyces subterraneus]|uniref:Dihydroorotase n=1 Tax=Polycladomyces subterraneus TaxID=1016997 RepID=A0ABT8IQG5_9BACL|nr:dihydroorotase [Polycladomyces subterraneus]MDN4594994.1 dihydroorotase [Polycladomyces subterraneus]
MNHILLKNGRILDEKTGEMAPADVRIENGVIAAVGRELPESGAETVDVAGRLIVPGLIDMHVHLREPGFEHKETIATGTAAAARGGFTTVACMPNTRPVADSPEVIGRIRETAHREGRVRVLPIAAITKRELGEELTDFAALKEAGAIALSDDGVGVQSARMMKQAMAWACELDLPIVAHCEDNSLAKGGCVHDGIFAAKLDLPGILGSAEAVHVARDIVLAEDTGVHYHVCHISAKASVDLVRMAKQKGLRVTAEVTPHHLLLSDEDIPGPDPMYKMNPPLRSAEDRAALLEALKDGTIDIIATDHAPHTAEEKAMGIRQAPFGIVGLETAFPLLYTRLVLTGHLTLAQLVEKLTRRPAELFGLPWGRLAEGQTADITVIDLDEERTIDPDNFVSKGKNTPFAGWRAKGWPVLTLVKGRVAWRESVDLVRNGQ